MRSTRPELDHLLLKLEEFRRSAIGVDELQKVLWGTAQGLSAHQDRKLREHLQDAEGRVEQIRFTVDQSRAMGEIAVVVDAVAAVLRSELAPST